MSIAISEYPKTGLLASRPIYDCIIFQIAGLAILGVGTYVRVMKTQYDELFGASALVIVTYIMIGAGALVVLVSLAGCVGAYTKSKPVLAAVSTWSCSGLYLYNAYSYVSHNMRFPTILYVRPAKAQISLRIRAVLSEPLLVA